MKEVTEEWLRAAADDLRVNENIASDEHLTHMVAFHSQQCIEKCLKALIEEHEIRSARIHNLERLFEIVRDHVHVDLDPALIETLDKLYLDARYPGDLGLLPEGRPTLAHAANFHMFAKSVYESIKADLESKK